MMPQIILHADDFDNERDFLQTEIERNLTGKLDSYIQKHRDPNHDIISLEAFFSRAKQGFDGKLVLTIANNVYRSEREDFEKLDDLVSHLFTHLKTQLAK